MKRTLKRELKVREIARRETFEISHVAGKSAVRTERCTFLVASQHQFRSLYNPWEKVAWPSGQVL